MVRPGMQDSRCFTSYLPNCQLNNNIQARNNIETNNEYRMFLQQHATEFIEQLEKVCFSDETKICNKNCKPY
tara:strand:- start:1819 stop:2034 length:216 start_codon:yes stop_codon:yes gene_type:complete